MSIKHPIKVAMIIQEYLPHVGGAERQLATLAPLLREQGVEIHIVTRHHPGLLRHEQINEVPVYRIPVHKSKILASLMYTFSAIPTLKSIHPQIIHAHGLLSPTTIAIIARFFFGIPVVSKSLRGGLLGDLKRLLNKPFGRFRFSILRNNVDTFITISKEIQEELEMEGVPHNKFVHIPNGVDLERFTPVSINEKIALRNNLQLPNGELVLFAGRLEAEKRVGDLIQIWPEVRKRNQDAYLLILGTGGEENALKELAGEGIHFLGLVDNVASYLQAADIFVLPSISEGLSNAFLEALASQLAVVVTATGGTTEIIKHKENGWLIEEYNTEKLIEGIICFLENKELREKCALEGKKYVEENYSIMRTAKKLNDLYNSLLSG